MLTGGFYYGEERYERKGDLSQLASAPAASAAMDNVQASETGTPQSSPSVGEDRMSTKSSEPRARAHSQGR